MEAIARYESKLATSTLVTTIVDADQAGRQHREQCDVACTELGLAAGCRFEVFPPRLAGRIFLLFALFPRVSSGNLPNRGASTLSREQEAAAAMVGRHLDVG